MNVVIITDSYGGPRQHNLDDVHQHETYPELLKCWLNAAGHSVIIDWAAFRKFTSIPALLDKYKSADLYVLQTGIVDVYPRPLSHRMTISKLMIAKVLRKLIRLNRPFFLRHFRSRPWSRKQDIENTCNEIIQRKKNFIFINVPPVNDFQERESPGANRAINEFNELLHIWFGNKSNCRIVDMHAMINSTQSHTKYLHDVDSHLTVAGNHLYFVELKKVLSSIFSS